MRLQLLLCVLLLSSVDAAAYLMILQEFYGVQSHAHEQVCSCVAKIFDDAEHTKNDIGLLRTQKWHIPQQTPSE